MAPRDLLDMTGRVALVTGAGTGLGARFCVALAEHGAAVAAVARRADKVESVAAAIRAQGGKAIAVSGDVTDPASIKQAFDAAEQAFGTVDAVVANAGIAIPGRAVETSDADWRAVMATNLDGVFFTGREAAQRLLAAGKPGAIVNIASILSYGVTKGTASYAVSKAAVAQVTQAMAYELAFKGIRVNAIAPGYVITDINRDYLTSEKGQTMLRDIPVGRFGEEQDLDGALLLLLSDAGRFMTGTVVTVDGGHRIGLRGV
ncbi:SDR family NAD(P)-dependent oxidoreductase [Phreatobacter stygius]|uniref:SDR family oxidoreductase n=1 Tax=Phreatobacter stygius TaxID=1940610 RepID=A0A4D7B082_9HYPH|nr:SDR family oxidoreductase [Phreatobacter stygius]QCI64238.1 SDR family oxidoreductase [Phreatobacter stygius]